MLPVSRLVTRARWANRPGEPRLGAEGGSGTVGARGRTLIRIGSAGTPRPMSEQETAAADRVPPSKRNRSSASTKSVSNSRSRSPCHRDPARRRHQRGEAFIGWFGESDS